jgi:hypothetical protein
MTATPSKVLHVRHQCAASTALSPCLAVCNRLLRTACLGPCVWGGRQVVFMTA